MISISGFEHMSESLGRRHQRLVGRGASAIWVALQAIAAADGMKGEVILPDMICSSVLEAIVVAGFTPRFADIDPDLYTISPDSVRSLLNPNTRAILVAHMFGHAAPMKEISEMARAHDVWLIEDAVQGVGGHAADRKTIGSHGDFSFISFDSNKAIRGRGAVLFFDDDIMMPYIDDAIDMIKKSSDTNLDNLLNAAARDMYHGIGQSVRLGVMNEVDASSMFRHVLPLYAHLLLVPFDDSVDNCDQIIRDWQNLSGYVQRNNERAFVLRQALGVYPVRQPPLRHGDAIWRYSVCFQSRDIANRFLVKLRSIGGAASSLYYPLNQLYCPSVGMTSTRTAQCIVNLFVDEKTSADYPSLVVRAAEDTLR